MKITQEELNNLKTPDWMVAVAGFFMVVGAFVTFISMLAIVTWLCIHLTWVP